MPFFTTTTLSLHHLPLLLLLLFFSSSCSTPHTRRILHQPIFTTDSPPPTSPPSPPTPDYPFSTPTPPGSPFFPDSPPPPPPPPSPSSLASFPANISSLNLPPSTKSKPTSTKLIAISISSILTAIILLLIGLSLHFKKRKNHSPNQPKNTPSETSSFNNTHATLPKLTRPSQTSSEFLYLGTLVNSHVVLNSNPNAVLNSNSHVVLNSNPTQQNVLTTRKMDSPELHPLPPLLNRQTPVNSGHQMGFSSRQLEGSEEFYSPRESVGVGSMSRRGFESVEVGKVNMSRSSSSSSSLYSGSPARSGSLSVSPSISASPNRAVSRPKSPELEAVELETLPIESDRVLDGSDNKDRNVLVFNPFRFSSVVDDENVGCSEENKDRVVRNEDDSDLEVSGLADQNEGLQPEDSEEHIRESSSLTSVVSDHNVDSLDVVTGLAENDNECLQESRRSDVSDQSVESLKSVIPVGGLEVKDNEYYTELHNSDVLDQSVSMVSGLAVKEDEYFPETRSSDGLDQSVESPKSVTSPVKGSGDTFESYSQSLDLDVQSPQQVASPVAEMVDVSELSSTSSNLTDHSVESIERFASPVSEMVDVSELHSTSSNVTDHSVESAEKFASPVTEIVDVSESHSTSFNVPDHSVESPEKFASPVAEMVDVSESYSTSSNVPDHSVESPERFPIPVSEMVDVSESYSTSSNVPDHSVVSPERFPIPVSEMVDVSESYSTSSNVPDHSVESPERFPIPVSEMVDVSESYSTSSNVPDHSVVSPERFPIPVSEMVDVSESYSTSSNVPDHSVVSPERFPIPVSEMVDVSESYSTSSNVPDHSVVSPERFPIPVSEMVDVSESYSTSSNVPDHSVVSPERFPIPVSEMVDVSESYSTSSIVPDHSVECPVKQDPPAVLDASEQLPPPIFVPPPPPPPPPRKFWESPRTPTSLLRKSISGPPALVAPLRPILIESPISISPMQLPTQSNNRESNESSEETPKPKLKPLHWDKVRASSDREMVWDQLRSSSFKLNEEMIESLFIVKAPNSTHVETTRRQILPLPNQDNRVLDAKKSQNIAILLKALHVTVDEVCESLLEGNAETLGTDLLESLLKMAPSKEEEHNLKEHKDDSPVKLGSAERFLKEVLDIPFAFKRIDAMLYISNFDSEVEYLKKSFETLETASEELRNSRMFLKLLEAVLKTGNRMNVGTNRGDAHAFKLDTLLKLVDIKGADGKTTLLHFVVQEITRTEGVRISESNPSQTSSNDDVKCRKLGLQVVSSLASDLTNVKKAAAMDSEVLNSDVMKLSKGLEKIMEVIRLNETIGSDQISSNKFSESMNKFMKFAEEEIIRIQAQESVALTLVKEITEYFHGNSAKEEAHPFRIFMVVRDFLSVLERVCKEVGMINERTIVSSAHKFPVPVNPMLQPVSSGFPGRRQNSSPDDEIPTS